MYRSVSEDWSISDEYMDVSLGKEKSKEKILKLMRENPRITTEKLAGILGISISAVEKNVRILKENGEIWRLGGDKGGQWKVSAHCPPDL